MYRKSRIKIMLLVMAILLAVLIGTLAIIYFTTYREVNSQNRDMLEMYADMYVANGSPQENSGYEEGADVPESDVGEAQEADEQAAADEEPFPEDSIPNEIDILPDEEAATAEADFDASRRYITSTFYSVAFNTDGTVLEITNDTMPLLDEDDLTEMALSLWQSGRTFGSQNDVVFLVTETEDYVLVTMMDNTVLGESIDSLLHYTILFGCIFILAAFLLSLWISWLIIRPLEESAQKQHQFISDAGHELKTPISTISANAELLSREIGENAWLKNIQYENTRMSVLVRQLLDLARLEHSGILPENVDLSYIVLAGVLPFEGIAYEKGLTLKYEIEENIQLRADATQIGELVSILVDNALSHSIPCGEVWIRLTAFRGGAVLSVENQGEEIPESEQKRIFEPFYRADEARGGDQVHYGLGLSIAQTIVQAHHGKISVNCSGGITTFEVQLKES